ncbi:MAG TPA: DUF2249 domain-containing protein [Pyrinomonadaceae bacterium]|jgi:uncharacterized protein (DUF2249 family)
MQRLDINDLIEINDEKFNPVVLVNEPDMRLLLLCLRAGQKVPEHSAAGSITVQAIMGRATFYDGDEACAMFAGTLVRLEAGRAHRVEAHTDTALLVTMIKTPQKAEPPRESRATEREIDLCLMPRPERHPLVFAAFDHLAVGESFIIFNDHDPQPLRMQIEQMREGEVDWEYLERGPDTFRVRLTRIAPPAGNVGPVNSGTAESPVTVR